MMIPSLSTQGTSAYPELVGKAEGILVKHEQYLRNLTKVIGEDEHHIGLRVARLPASRDREKGGYQRQYRHRRSDHSGDAQVNVVTQGDK